MTSFQDTPDEAMEDDEAMEVRSTRNSKLHWMFHLELLQQILSIAKVETFFPRNSDSFFGLVVAVRLGWANFRFLVELGLSADPLFLSFMSNPLGHPPFSSTWQSSQRSQLLFGFRSDAQDTTTFVEHFLMQHGICSSAVQITRVMAQILSSLLTSTSSRAVVRPTSSSLDKKQY